MLFLPRKFTRLPHLAGTKQNLVYAEQIREEWLSFGLDSIELVPYDVLLSYPNNSQPNYISIVDQLGNEVYVHGTYTCDAWKSYVRIRFAKYKNAQYMDRNADQNAH